MPIPTVTLHTLFAVLLVAAVVLPRRRAALAGAGLAGYALGAGAFAAVPGIVAVGPLAEKLEAVGLSPVFVGINVGLMALGAAATMIAGLMALSEERAAPRVVGGSAGVAAILVLAGLVPLLRVSGFAAAVAAAAVLGAAVIVAIGAGAAERLVLRNAAAAAPSQPGGGAGALPRAPVAVASAAAVSALVAPHALVIVGSALVAAVAAHVAARRAGAVPRVPVLPLAAALGLVPFAWLLTTIAGPVGLSTASLPIAPLSPPAQAMLVPMLVIGAWGFLGVWPLHRWVPGPILAAVGGALLLRIGAPALGAGLEHLQPPIFALCAVAAWHAALTRRAAAFLASLGGVATAAIFSGAHVSPDARVAAAVLFAAASGVAALGGFLRRQPERHRAAVEPVSMRILALAGGAAVYAALGAGLRSEVVLTVLTAAAAAAAAWRLRGAGPAPASIRPPLSSGSSTSSNTVRSAT